MKKVFITGFALLVFIMGTLQAQEAGKMQMGASIREEIIKLKTYPYSDPDPVPNIDPNRNVYPNFRYEKYSSEGIMKDWNFVILENQYIKVYILPEEGGKVWGAVEKSTGKEFIYKNEVVKYRNLGQRGPWTSGGIEFNFGIIGHSPSTASMVDYIMEEHDDGSVSCTVGTMDLTSRTSWRVRISLHPDKAWLETHSSWFNPTELDQAYYNWMTAAAAVSEDLEYYYPGHLYLEHSGEVKAYPMGPDGRNLSKYSENAFGPDKSYHVVGSFQDFFGGYYKNQGYGFGHWAQREAMAGQKIWMWSQARSGAIWEDLLTDSDGQYMEFQAGRMFNQYSPGKHRNPISKAGFGTHTYDQWTELWFPYLQIGGMIDASPHGVLNVEEKAKGVLTIGISALTAFSEPLAVIQGGKEIFRQSLSLAPMEVKILEVDLDENDLEQEVILGDNLLYYSSDRKKFLIKRPFECGDEELSSSTRMLMEATEAYRTRKYELALKLYNEVAETDPLRFDVLAGQAKCFYRMGKNEEALEYANLILRQNTYHSEANYLAGIIYRATGDFLNAREAFGWAARDIKYRTSAFCQTGEILLRDGRLGQASNYLNQALDFNIYNLNALSAQALISRLQGNKKQALDQLETLLKIDPLSHFAHFERAMLEESTEAMQAFHEGIKNELRNETIMELALHYYRLGRLDETRSLLSMCSDFVSAEIWRAYLLRETDPEQSRILLSTAVERSPAFVFPYRLETLAALNWANGQSDSWKIRYYLGLNLMAVSDKASAQKLFEELGPLPDFAPFYLFRADQFYRNSTKARAADLLRARELDGDNWRVLYSLTEHYLLLNQTDQAALLSKEAMDKHPDQFRVGLQHIQIQIRMGEYEAAIGELDQIRVLPAEAAYLPRILSELASLSLSLEQIGKKQYKAALMSLEQSLLWPENIGVGKPYDYDSRRQDMLRAYCMKKLGKVDEALALQAEISEDKHGELMFQGLRDENGELPERIPWYSALQHDILTQIISLYQNED